MEDIEDMIIPSDRPSASTVGLDLCTISKNFKNKVAKTKIYDKASLDEKKPGEASVPGSQKVCVVTFGCSHNVSDSEFMMGQLAEYGYTLVDDAVGADAVVINSCTVKNPSEQSALRMVSEYKALGKPVVLSGCVPQGDRNIKGLEDVSILGVTQIDRVVEVIENSLNGQVTHLLEKKSLPQLDLPKIRRNKFIEVLSVNSGCLGNCTYCKTKHARGHLGSYHPTELVKRVARACEEGISEVWMTSEDTGAYGLDLGTNIVELLVPLVESLPDHVMLRIGMTNPPYILEHLEAIACVLRHPRVFGFLHIPVQSGSDTVLERMNREYTAEEFSRIVDYLSENVPQISFATDIICGFPGETDAEHKLTLDLLNRHQIAFVNISQFYPRPGTIAAKMKQLDTKVKKARSKEVTELFNAYRTTQKHLNTVQRVWFSERETNKHNGDICVGHLKDYTKVVVPFEERLMGKSMMIKVTDCKKWHVEGELIEGTEEVEKADPNYFDELRAKLEAKKKALEEKSTEAEPEASPSTLTPTNETAHRPISQNLVLASAILLIVIAALLRYFGY